ncbi:MAG TPA: hypothetical protein PL048_16780 [Leptospiraceae bacterium]|nr:hypothetical protein [Leptospiraceae bacterium]HMY69510.1 hypothetical protein [Leptospiraceae bacterium]HMZ60435.1 hypothetical protein [Leptospiraceae bacterium]HNF15052.1 hypothetical protein [Leptospiraceae bacterium]HNF27683.1 hypothetical protein [Leptospiraceae bacterium]
MNILWKHIFGILILSSVISAQDEPKFLELDFRECRSEKNRIYYAFGSTAYEMKKGKEDTCIFRYGREVENPRWKGTLDTVCTVPSKTGRAKFKIENTYIDFSEIKKYCSNVN